MDHLSREPRIPTKKVLQGHARLSSVMGWDDTYRKALYTHLSATVCRSVQRAVSTSPPMRGSMKTKLGRSR
jgi:hypothetical protein